MTVEQLLAEQWPIESWLNLRVLLAVSGGPDSVAMLCAILRLRCSHESETDAGTVEVVHFNHLWRSDESDADEAFVRELCSTHQLRCHVGHATNNKRTEAVARDQRYAFFQQIAEQRGARFLATGHTMDDQAETVLHRVIRGTGLAGLGGIRPRRQLSEAVTLVRPMLMITRQQVVDYLDDLTQRYCEDTTNDDLQFTRNKIRRGLLPMLREQYNPAVVVSLTRLSVLAREAEELIRHHVDVQLSRCLEDRDADSVVLKVEVLAPCSGFLQRELFSLLWRQQGWPKQSMGFEEWHRLSELLGRDAVVCLPGKIRAEKSGNELRIHRTTS